MDSSQFANYIMNPLSYEQMKLLYSANNIKYDKVSLYYDFIISLNRLVDKTYLGDNYISTNEEIKGHFDWCFDKTIENFKKEKINFDDNDELRSYFFFYYDQLYYKDQERSLEKIDNLPKFSFDYYKLKSMSDIDILVELYRLFEKTLKNV
jgi:hypothetical protein